MGKVQPLPRNHRGRAYERIGLRIRSVAGVSLDSPIDPFALAKLVKIRVITPSQLRHLPPMIAMKLTGQLNSCWSAVTLRLTENRQLCVLNPTHEVERQRATLMEEIAHVALGHELSRIIITDEGFAYREFNRVNEHTAYGVGAAALVPYVALLDGLRKGRSPERIARQYAVSIPLVLYRIKITMLWRVYQNKAS